MDTTQILLLELITVVVYVILVIGLLIQPVLDILLLDGAAQKQTLRFMEMKQLVRIGV